MRCIKKGMFCSIERLLNIEYSSLNDQALNSLYDMTSLFMEIASMNKLQRDLFAAVAYWRKMSAEAELASVREGKPFAKGYLRGIALACDNAAKRMEAIIIANGSKVRPAALKITHRVLHGKRQAPPPA